jgi:hypothetical protein
MVKNIQNSRCGLVERMIDGDWHNWHNGTWFRLQTQRVLLTADSRYRFQPHIDNWKERGKHTSFHCPFLDCHRPKFPLRRLLRFIPSFALPILANYLVVYKGKSFKRYCLPICLRLVHETGGDGISMMVDDLE